MESYEYPLKHKRSIHNEKNLTLKVSKKFKSYNEQYEPHGFKKNNSYNLKKNNSYNFKKSKGKYNCNGDLMIHKDYLDYDYFRYFKYHRTNN